MNRKMALMSASGRLIWDEIEDGVYIVDLDGQIVFWNRMAERITGYSSEEAVNIGRCRALLLHVDAYGNLLCHDRCPVLRVLQNRERVVEELYLMHKTGYRVPVSIRAALLTDDAGEAIGVMELFRDKSAQLFDRDRLEILKSMAHLDPLLKIPNRGYLEQQLAILIDELKRFGTSFGIVFLDIDHFKQVNDTFGHSQGDVALKTVTSTLVANLRPLDIVGRWGGEEFLVITTNATMPRIEAIAGRYAMLIRSSRVEFNGQSSRLTVTIGATMARGDDTIESLIGRADALMYSGKRSGRDRVVTG